MTVILRKDQTEDMDWLLKGDRRGLFNDPGTGKSFPAIMAALDYDAPHNLLVAPQYLLYNWVDMLVDDFGVPREEIGFELGETPKRNAVLENTDLRWTLINYEWFSYWSKFPQLLKRKWDVTIADECHKVRGRNSASTKAMYKLKTDVLWPMTGTPICNNAGDVFPYLKMMDKERFRSYWRFVDEFCKQEMTPWGILVKGPLEDRGYFEMLQQYATMRPFDSIPELTKIKSVEKPMFVELPASVIASHRRALKEYILDHPNLERVEKDSAGAILHLLRKMCSFPPTQEQPKWKVLAELMPML